jgi:hypothetical protein
MVSTIMDTGAFTDKDHSDLEAWLVAFKSYDQYRARLWGAAVRLFNGGRDANFIATFARTVDVQLTQAFNKGADEMGFSPEDMGVEDTSLLSAIIDAENNFIDGMVNDIMTARDDGMDRQQFDTQFGARVNMWSTRYTDVINQARVHFGGIQKLVWVRGPTSDGCENCIRLNGTVATARAWAASGWKPQGEMLACNGFHCLCELRPTDKPLTRGGIPI